MAKVSELKKVKSLEAAVLDNDRNAVKDVIQKYGDFEFTARALGLACRFCGAEMVSLLLDFGASFEYNMTSNLKRKYNCTIGAIENTYITNKMDYTLYLFPQFILKDFDKEVIDDSQRKKVLRTLLDHQAVDVNRMLYYAIIYDDVLLRTLSDMGIKKFDGYWSGIKKIPNIYAPHNKLDKLRHFRFSKIGTESDYDEIKRIIYNFRDCMDTDKIGFKDSHFYPYHCNEVSWDSCDSCNYCSEKLFSFLATNTDIPERAGKWRMMYGLVNKGNISGIEYIFTHKWIKNRSGAQRLLTYATEKNASPEIIALLLQNQNELFPEAKKKGTTKRNALSASSIKVKDWDYKNLEDGTIMITTYIGEDKDVVIPSVIGSKTVTAIDSKTFRTTYMYKNEESIKAARRREKITSVEFPGSITEIPRGILQDNKYIQRVIIDTGCKKLSDNAFEYCTASEIEIPDTVMEIGLNAFSGCKNLKTVHIPNRLTKISDNTFMDCTSLENIEIPDTVREIGTDPWQCFVFNDCDHLKSVKLPEGIKELPEWLFNGCKALESIEIPDSVEKIGNAIFRGCGQLKSVKLPEGIKELPEGLFNGCSALESIEIPEKVERVGVAIFQDCHNLKSVKLPEKIKEIPDNMFWGCEALESIEIPGKVEKIGDFAFGKTSIERINIPDSVTSIGYRAFFRCKKLKELTLSNMTSLEDEAFSGCALLANQNQEIIVNDNYFGPKDYTGNVDKEQYLTPWFVKSEFSKLAIPHQNAPAIVWRECTIKDTEIDYTVLNAGDVIEFGRFPYYRNCNITPIKWRVLEVKDGRALLITEDEIILFNHSYYNGDIISPEVGAIRWDVNPIRKLLNEAFYDLAFTSKEKEQIDEKRLKTSNIHSSSGKKNKKQASDEVEYFETLDKVFVLSKDEVVKYMPKVADRKCIATEYALKDSTQVKEAYSLKNEDQNISVWDLREVGESIKSEDGSKCTRKAELDCYIRPAIWIRNRS